MNVLRRRRGGLVLTAIIAVAIVIFANGDNYTQQPAANTDRSAPANSGTQFKLATTVLANLAVKGRAPKTGYTREQFGDGWSMENGCDTRNIILNRDLTNVVLNDQCQVVSGDLNDPYTGKLIQFRRGANTSQAVQIDHVVALSDAWQTGAQQLSRDRRVLLANDPLELLAVDGPQNQKKSDGDAATWLPPNKAFRCEYVARQIAVKNKYSLWVTSAEKAAIERVLIKCPEQTVPG